MFHNKDQDQNNHSCDLNLKVVLHHSEYYGTLTYYDDEGIYHEEKVPTVDGDYARVYDGIYDSIVYGKEQVIQQWQTILQMEMLETGVKDLK